MVKKLVFALVCLTLLGACEISLRPSVSLAPVSRSAIQEVSRAGPDGNCLDTTGLLPSPRYYSEDLDSDDLVIGYGQFASDDRPRCQVTIHTDQHGHLFFDLSSIAPAVITRDDLGTGRIAAAALVGEFEDVPENRADPYFGCRVSPLGNHVYGVTTGNLGNLSANLPTDNLDLPPPVIRARGMPIDDVNYSTAQLIGLADYDDVYVAANNGSERALFLPLNDWMIEQLNRVATNDAYQASYLYGLTVFTKLNTLGVDLSGGPYNQTCYTRFKNVRLVLFFERAE